MNTETKEMKICSGCHLPSGMGQLLIPLQHGHVCGACVKASMDKLTLATRGEYRLERVRRALAHIQDLATPGEHWWWSESDVLRLDVLASQLFNLAHHFARKTGPFADDVDGPEESASMAADGAERPTTAVPALRLAQPPLEAVTALPSAGGADDGRIYAIVCDVLNAELLDWPTPRMRVSLERHGIDDAQAKLGLQEMLDEIRDHGEYVDDRPQLTLVRALAEAPPAPGDGDSSAAADTVEQAVPAIRGEARSWIDHLEAWIQSVDLSPEQLARRARRERVTVIDLFERKDRQTSLRLFLDLVRHAGARLGGVPDSTPHALFRRLKELSAKQGLSITTLARRSGLHRSHVSTLFNSPDPNPCLSTVQRIVAALGAEAEVNLVALEQGQAALGVAERV